MADLPIALAEGFSGIAALGPGGAKILAPLAKTVATSGTKGVVRRLRSSKQASEVRRLLGVEREANLYYRVPSASHPLLTSGSAHPDDLAAFLALAGPSLYAAYRRGWLERVEALDLDLEQNLVLIGSPEVDALTRLYFDYRRPSKGPGVYYVGQTIKVPYRWHEDPSDVAQDCARFVRGHGEVVRPNWPLVKVALDTGVETRYIPRTDPVGNRLLNDYLLITSMPNFLTQAALDGGRRVISVGGVHGVGTASVAQLLKSGKVLNEIGASLIGQEHRSIFQVLLEARDIDHDSERGSRARTVRLVDVWSEDLPFELLRQAKETVTSRFSDWVLEDEYRNMPNPEERR